MTNHLKSDCQNCFALCCVALPYTQSADFPVDKEGGVPCQNLCSNNLCSIHDKLRGRGFYGCVSYECFGAGQYVSQSIYEGQDWRVDEERAKEMFAVFPVVQQLHEMLWYLNQAMELKETESIHSSLEEVFIETKKLTEKTPKDILKIDIVTHRYKVRDWLIETSKMYRASVQRRNKKRKQKTSDYIGANLKGINLQGEDFRGNLFIAANLSQSDLRKADFLGADLRNANLCGADLTDALFLTQSQINAAIGDRHTKIPSYLDRPSHWGMENIS